VGLFDARSAWSMNRQSGRKALVMQARGG